MMKLDPSKAIGGYAAAMTAIALWARVAGAMAPPTRFETIDVKRINVRTDDGTLRMILAGRGHIGGPVIGDREYPHTPTAPRPASSSSTTRARRTAGWYSTDGWSVASRPTRAA